MRFLNSLFHTTVVDRDFTTLLAEEDSYAGKNSGFALSCIDGMLLGVYEYSPMDGSSYLTLPPSIADRKAVINPQNIDLECFKWAILAKHVPSVNSFRVGANYFSEEHRYDFSTISVPTPVSEIILFERANPDTSINGYGCFTSFDDRPLRYKLHGEEALARHRLVCGTHKPILPILPPEGSTLEFTTLCKTQRLPFVMYADFEALLVKSAQRYGVNTEALHTHHPMSYGFMVVAADGVPAELMEQFGIKRSPIVFHGSETVDDVAKRFVMDMAEKISKLLKTVNVSIVMTARTE
ncbi:hypothetical protein QTP88_015515 [Uroleucon formosanum]